MRKKILSLISFGCLLLGMSTLPYIIINLFQINISNFNEYDKIIYSFLCDILFMVIIIIIYHKTLIKDLKNFLKILKIIFNY